jgi:hypothetical protein
LEYPECLHLGAQVRLALFLNRLDVNDLQFSRNCSFAENSHGF